MKPGKPAHGAGMPLRGDRIHRYVNAFCPRCHDDSRPLSEVERLSGWLSIRDGRVWLERGCRTHGWIRTLYDENPEILAYLEQWTAPTKAHLPDTPGNFLPTPEAFAHGLPEVHSQHTCTLLEDITDHCNLSCPTCFASSAPALTAVAPVDQVLANVRARLERENGHLDVLMLSGGEPTLHPEFARIVEALVALPITRILVNTNGLTVARDDALLALLAQHRQRVEVYLQYDGGTREASVHHRGGDLRRQKDAAIERLTGAGVFVTLTMTAALGVNDDQIGHVIQRALATPYIGGVSIQPVLSSGRSAGLDPMDRLTHTGVLSRLDAQTGGVVTWRDLTALPCSHPHCMSVGYLLKDDAGAWRSLVAIMGPDRLKQWLDLDPGTLANRIADLEIPRKLRTALKGSLLDLLSEQNSLTHPDLMGAWRDVCTACDLGISTLATLAAGSLPGGQERMRALLADRVVRITVKPFMDVHTMIEERLTQCCVHVGTTGEGGAHQCAPFCAVQAWRPLSDSRLSTSTARTLEVIP